MFQFKKKSQLGYSTTWHPSNIWYDKIVCERNKIIAKGVKIHYFAKGLVTINSFKLFSEKVYFKSLMLVHEYWTILDHYFPTLWASG